MEVRDPELSYRYGISAEESVDTEYRPGIAERILNWAGGGGWGGEEEGDVGRLQASARGANLLVNWSVLYRKYGVLISQLEKFCLLKVQDEQNDFLSGLAFPNQHLRIL